MSKCNERRIAYDVLLAVERGGYANLTLKKMLSQNEQANADLVSALTYTTLDHQITIDFYIDHYAKGRIAPVVRVLLRLGIAQLLYMRFPMPSVVDETVKICKSIGKSAVSGFVNAILRNVVRNIDNLPTPQGCQFERMSIQYSYPKFLVEQFINDFGADDCEKLFQYEPDQRLCIRANTVLMPEQELDAELEARGIFYEKGKLVSIARYLNFDGDISKDQLFLEGKIAIQSESAMFAAKVCAAQPGFKVLDACAAPGGKTAFLASVMKNCGEIVAWDIHAHRVELIWKTMQRLGINIVEAEQHDASKADDSYVEMFDIVLLDVPCSGLGLLNSKPDIRYSKDAQDILELAKLQRILLAQISKYVKKSGMLVYVTCTMTSQENAKNIDWFLQAYPDFSPLPFEEEVEDFFGKRRCENGQIQILPFLDNMEGFYIARLKRN